MADAFLKPYVRAVWQMLRLRLGSGRRMCIYGAGAHTRWLLSVVSDLPSPPVACIIDDDPSNDALNGIPVCTPDDVDVQRIDAILISSDQWEEKLADRARDLWGPRVEIVRLYEGLPPGPYDKTDDRAEALERLARTVPAESRTARLVVMVSDHPRSREAKLAFALRHAGWRTILLHRRPPAFDVDACFEEAHSYTNQWAALRLACDYSPVAFHVMVNGDYRVAETFVRHRPGPVVIDSYDVIAQMYTDAFLDVHPVFREEIPRERFCLEHTDGCCCRHREIDYLVEHCGYDVGPRIFVEDGCWNLDPPPRRPHGKELHVAYVGVMHEPDGGAADFAAAGFSRPIADALAHQHVHVHVYPNRDPERDQGGSVKPFTSRSDVRGQGAVIPNLDRCLHFHPPVAADRIAAALAAYDFGALVYTENVIPTGAPWFITPAKTHASTSNKLFDYLDAGLPVIHNARPGSLIREIVTAHRVGIDVTDWPIEEWGRRLGRMHLDDFADELAQARRDHDVRRNIHRLTDFYEQVRQSHESQNGRSALGGPAENALNADGRSHHRPAFV